MKPTDTSSLKARRPWAEQNLRALLAAAGASCATFSMGSPEQAGRWRFTVSLAGRRVYVVMPGCPFGGLQARPKAPVITLNGKPMTWADAVKGLRAALATQPATKAR